MPKSKFFFFNDTATTEIYTLSLHDALPIYGASWPKWGRHAPLHRARCKGAGSEEHTSELQSRPHLVCRLLLEKKKKVKQFIANYLKKINKSITLNLSYYPYPEYEPRSFSGY